MLLINRSRGLRFHPPSLLVPSFSKAAIFKYLLLSSSALSSPVGSWANLAKPSYLLQFLPCPSHYHLVSNPRLCAFYISLFLFGLADSSESISLLCCSQIFAICVLYSAIVVSSPLASLDFVYSLH